MTLEQRVEWVQNILHDEINDCRSLLECEEDGIDVENTENHLDFCLDLLEKLG